MSETGKKSGWVGRIVGLLVAAAAVYAVFFLDWGTETRDDPRPIRPVKTMVIESPSAWSGRKFPGKVKANQKVDLAFQVAGPLIELPVKAGQEVAEGELLARLDPRDFQNSLDAAEANLVEAKSLWERMERLYQEGHAQEVEYEQNKRKYGVAKAEAEQARKNLEDTYLRAPFAGVIANRMVENFQNVRAKQQILSLQDVSSVEIEVNVPEERMALALKDMDKIKAVATFDFLPGREFIVELKEISTEADPATQTYAATGVMAAPQDVNILPGMTATITTYREGSESKPGGGYAVPADAVPVDGLGNYFVWVVKESADRAWTVHRREVTVGEMMQESILVTDGLEQGDRIATAGVHFLEEGQQVRLLVTKAGGDGQ